MNIPRYWARCEAEADTPQRHPMAVVAWGWSDRNMAEAEQRARQSADNLAARIRSGERLPDSYGYGSERPLREEIISEHGTPGRNDSAVVTRNAYGALVLNTARVMFIDVDIPSEPSSTAAGPGLLDSIIGLFRGRPAAPPPVEAASAPSAAERAILDKVGNWVARNPDWGFRVYRTAAGVRLLVTHDTFDPKGSEVSEVMKALGSDPLYMRLCRAQECFRARLTPKPWRVGLQAPLFRHPWVGTHAERTAQRWLADYERACAKAATCRLVTTLGNTRIDSPASSIIRIHDEATRVGHEVSLDLA